MRPINYRLVAEEVSYIANHCEADVLMVDPQLDKALISVKAKHRFVIGSESDEQLCTFGVEAQPWAPDEDATAGDWFTQSLLWADGNVASSHYKSPSC